MFKLVHIRIRVLIIELMMSVDNDAQFFDGIICDLHLCYCHRHLRAPPQPWRQRRRHSRKPSFTSSPLTCGSRLGTSPPRLMGAKLSKWRSAFEDKHRTPKPESVPLGQKASHLLHEHTVEAQDVFLYQ